MNIRYIYWAENSSQPMKYNVQSIFRLYNNSEYVYQLQQQKLLSDWADVHANLGLPWRTLFTHIKMKWFPSYKYVPSYKNSTIQTRLHIYKSDKGLYFSPGYSKIYRQKSDAIKALDKMLFSIQKYDIFLFLHENICCGYSLEAPLL